ncbi:MAG: hypothetical protein R3C53_27270 [Pirellulaceae bacterium]
MVYPPPEVWQALTARRRERYGAINLGGSNDSEQRIFSALKQEVEVQYQATPLRTIIENMSTDLNIPIVIDEEALLIDGIDPDQPINLELPPISMRSALRLILKKADPEPLTVHIITATSVEYNTYQCNIDQSTKSIPWVA